MKYHEMKIDADKLKHARQQKGWTQQHLADVSGISLRTIQRAESNGATSHETVSALCAIFAVQRSHWQPPDKPGVNRSQVIRKGWWVALGVIAVAQMLALIVVWLWAGEINSLWLKALATSWLGLILITVVVFTTFKTHKINSFQALKTLNKQVMQQDKNQSD